MTVLGEMLIMPETAGGSFLNPLAASLKDVLVAEEAKHSAPARQVTCCDQSCDGKG